MHRLPNDSYRSRELQCRLQAAISTNPDTRKELERMAQEYKLWADLLEGKSSEAPQPRSPHLSAAMDARVVRNMD
jgi:hypothetical protein